MLEFLLLAIFVFIVVKNFPEGIHKKPVLSTGDSPLNYWKEPHGEIELPYRPLYSKDFNATEDTQVYNVL